MPAVSTHPAKLFDAAELAALCEAEGPCLTVYLPIYRPGDGTGSRAARIKHLLRAATEMAEKCKPKDKAEALIAGLRELMEGPHVESGGKPLALFSLPGRSSMYSVDSSIPERLELASVPVVKPLLKEASVLRDLFILGLSRKHVRLWQCHQEGCQEMTLPNGVLANMLEAGDYDQPDHNLANRSSSGASTGAMGGVRFTTASDRESAPEYLHHYFTLLDQALHPVLRQTPLMLAGVAEEVAAYRRVARYSHLLETEFDGSPELLTGAEGARHARAAALRHYESEAERILQTFRDMPERHRTASRIADVLQAAEQGRVHQVIVAEDVVANESGADALNAIAVETIRKGGQAFTLPAERMGQHSPVAAILRY